MDLEPGVVACAQKQSVSLGSRAGVRRWRVRLCALVATEEERVVFNTKSQDELRRRDEGRGVLEARLPVDAHHAERERIVLIN